MNSIQKILLERRDSIFAYFDQVYLFGSTWETEAPCDLDLLLIYSDDQDLQIVAAEMQDVLNTLCSIYEGLIIDLTTLSKSELKQTKFLEQILHEQIV